MLSPEHEDSLLRNRVACLKCLHVTQNLKSALLADYSLTEDMCEEITSLPKSADQVGKLLTLMGKRSEKAFCTLIHGLIDDAQDVPATLLDKKMAEGFIKARNEKRQRTAQNGADVTGIAVHPSPSQGELGGDDSKSKSTQQQSSQQVSNNIDDNTDGSTLSSTIAPPDVTIQSPVNGASVQPAVAHQNQPGMATSTQSYGHGSVTAPYQQYPTPFQLANQVPMTYVMTPNGPACVPMSVAAQWMQMMSSSGGDASSGATGISMPQFPCQVMPNSNSNANVGGYVSATLSTMHMQQPGYMQMPLSGEMPVSNVNRNSINASSAYQQRSPGVEPAPGDGWKPKIPGTSTTTQNAGMAELTLHCLQPGRSSAASFAKATTVPAVDPAVKAIQTAAMKPLTHPADETVQKVVVQPSGQALGDHEVKSDEVDSSEKREKSGPSVTTTPSSRTCSQSREEREELKRYLAIVSGPEASASLENLISEINVTKSTPQAGAYSMNHPVHGRVVIIDNKYFANKDTRLGTEHDVKNLTALFTKFGYQVVLEQHKTKQDIEAILKRERTLGQDNYDAFIFVALSHGKEGIIYGSDGGEVSIDYVMEQFDGKHCPNLNDKPKVFMIQACQGVSNSYMSDGAGADDGLGSDQFIDDGNLPEITVNLHEKADMFVLYATVKGYSAWRHCELGSCFVRTIVYVFAHYAHQQHLTDMFTTMNNFLSTLKAEEGNSNRKINLIAECKSSFRKSMFFHADLAPNPLLTSCMAQQTSNTHFTSLGN